MRKRLLLGVLLFVAAVVLALPLSASAACGVWGKITYTVSYPGYTQVFIEPLSSSYLPATIVYYFNVNSYYISDQVAAANASGRAVYLVGNVSACPTSGTVRYGGVVTQANVNIHY